MPGVCVLVYKEMIELRDLYTSPGTQVRAFFIPSICNTMKTPIDNQNINQLLIRTFAQADECYDLISSSEPNPLLERLISLNKNLESFLGMTSNDNVEERQDSIGTSHHVEVVSGYRKSFGEENRIRKATTRETSLLRQEFRGYLYELLIRVELDAALGIQGKSFNVQGVGHLNAVQVAALIVDHVNQEVEILKRLAHYSGETLDKA
jgi:hypothetical protein